MRGAQLQTLDLRCKCCTWLVVSGVASGCLSLICVDNLIQSFQKCCSGNDFGDPAAESVRDVLKACTGLQTVHLRECFVLQLAVVVQSAYSTALPVVRWYIHLTASHVVC